MKKVMNTKLVITIVIFTSILFMTIGYSALNVNLTISGEASVIPQSFIEVTNISIKSQENGGLENYNSAFIGNQSNIHVSLPNQNSTITYEIEVTNDTINNYYLNNIEELSTNNINIKYEIINKESIFIAPNSVQVIEIKFYYDSVITSNVDLSLSLRYDFISVPFENLEYIVSTGTQYIDTGIMNTGDYTFESEYWFETNLEKDGVWLFSGRKTTEYTLGFYMLNGGTIINSYGGTTLTYSGKYFPIETWHELYYSRTKASINGFNVPVIAQKLVPEEHGASILLGANIVNWDGGIDTRYFIGRIQYFKITDVTTGNLIRNFVPVKLNDTNEVLYWDTVEKQYYSNIGTGAFTSP